MADTGATPAVGDLPGRALRLAIACALMIGVAALYSPVRHYDYVQIDDNEYVTENPHVREGLSRPNVDWALTAYHSGHWHPLTWLSLMADCHWSDADPGALHVGNVLLHAAGTALLFLAMTLATGEVWPSAFLAALFALHPLRVESVAWVAARKDVLSGFFLMATLWSYAAFAARETPARYLRLVLAFALALLAKPTVAVVPCGLLLLDYWPLGRTNLLPPLATDSLRPPRRTRSLAYLVAEKLPLLLLSVLTLSQTMAAQKAAGALMSAESAPFASRLANALWGTARHLGHTIWPFDLAVFYPLMPVATALAAGSAIAILTATWFCWRQRARRPWLLIGWLWFLGTLLPVSGIVQFGGQSMADRYAYIPHVGLFLLVTWELADIVRRRELPKVATFAIAALLLGALASRTSSQIAYWRTSETLFEQALKVTTNNYFIHNNLGVALAAQGRREEAGRHYEEAARLSPGWPEARNNFGITLAERGDLPGARENFEAALRVRPNFARAENNLGTAWAHEGNFDAAIPHYERAVELDPGYFDAVYALADALERRGRLAEAAIRYDQAAALRPDWAPLQDRLRRVRQTLGPDAPLRP